MSLFMASRLRIVSRRLSPLDVAEVLMGLIGAGEDAFVVGELASA